MLTNHNLTINAPWNESPHNWWFFAISPNTVYFAYFRLKCGGFFGIYSIFCSLVVTRLALLRKQGHDGVFLRAVNVIAH
jgi:hypothetical protein